MQTEYQICNRCIMDTSDPEVQFNEQGICNHCKLYFDVVSKEVFDGTEGEVKLKALIQEIKQAGVGREYDCIIGISGGVDSTYAAYLIKQYGLRPLAVHMDNGWNSELAVSNIEKMLKKLDIDLYTYVLNWEEFKNLQLSFLKASVPDLEIPTDHAITALIYKIAAEKGIKYIISGMNYTTELIMPREWSQGHTDWKYIKTLHGRFGRIKLKTFPYYTIWDQFFYRFIKKQRVISVLNYISYVKEDVIKVLEKELDWQYYGGKHYESIYTRFIQSYILPKKFNFDKRRAHLSNLICAGQISREDALREMEKEIYPEDKMRDDKEFALKKLGLNELEFEELMNRPNKSFWDYPSYRKTKLFNMAKSIYCWLKGLKNK